MKRIMLAIATLVCALSAIAKNKERLPFAPLVESPTPVILLIEHASTETQYLGFNWINTYCFGALGCAVSNNPATATHTERNAILRLGPWLLYVNCTQYTLNFHSCESLSGNPITVKTRNDGSEIYVLDASSRVTKYNIKSAYNTDTRMTWGMGSTDEWREVIATISIANALKKMDVDHQIEWATKLKTMRDNGLTNASNLEAVLAEMSR